MAINYIPNDPMAGSPANTQNAAVANRTANEVRMTVTGLPNEATYPIGTPEFVYWQSREAAFRTLDVFEGICGKLIGWQGSAGRKTLKLIPLAGNDINAYYDRNSVSFFEAAVGATTVFSGASADVVAHEVGHAILDSLRPDLWNVTLMEVAAFHEGFGDCMAVMFALSDRPTRQALVAAGGLGAANFVEATAEELSDAIRRAVGPNHNAAKPRHARNQFQWALPPTLPANGPPGTLINEAHSLGQLTSGIYYDLIVNLLGAGTSEAALWTACQQATKLIVEAARQCPIAPRFFESWGRTMLAIDQAQSGGTNAPAIKGAFSAHGIAVSAAGFLAPQATLVSHKGKRKAAKRKAKGPAVTLTARNHLRGMLNLGANAALRVRPLDLGPEPVSEVSTDIEVDLTGLSERLSNVKSTVPRPFLVGGADGGEAVLGAVQSSVLLSSAVREFVETLVTHKSIDFGDNQSAPNDGKKVKKSAVAAGYLQQDNAKTFAIVEEQGQAQLRRVAFSCGCCLR